jgi:hypothetical protein
MPKTETTTRVEAFRKELTRLMPGYKWTLHTPLFGNATYLKATGIQSSGSNRISTLEVVRQVPEGDGQPVSYECQSSGYGVGSRWLTDTPVYGPTLAQSLRRLQEHYESQSSIYAGATASLRYGRQQRKEEHGG